MNNTIFPSIFPEPWAHEWGEDAYGLFMVLNVKDVLQRFRWIAPGTFSMGSPERELERDDDEIQHSVTLTQGYWLADTACTQALWQAVMGNNPSRFNDDANNPVETVSWNDVEDFIQRLNRIVPGLTARLPTEAEWEYACRAGTTTPFSFGPNITPEQVNYNANYPYADGVKGWYRGQTVAVKSLPANPWGVYEMHGNVSEWCQDWYGEYGSEAVVNPTGADNASERVLRGGSWLSDGWHARSARRNRFYPVGCDGLFGFRLAIS